MTVSPARAKRVRFLVHTVCLGLLLVGLGSGKAALAQQSGASVGVTQEVLTEISKDGAGVLSKEAGGFGPSMWMGTPRHLVESLLPKMPTANRSHTMQSLARRLLLSLSGVPAGPGTDNALITTRAAHLADMGNTNDFEALLKATPSHHEVAALIRIEAEQNFLSGDHARGCSAALTEIDQNRDIFWEKALIFCQILSGDAAKAGLGVSLLREMGDEDPAFYQLVDILVRSNGKKAKDNAASLESLENPTALHFSMARVAGVGLPKRALGASSPAVLKAIATDPNTAIDLRLEAAEAAEATGALDVRALVQIYTAMTFDKDVAKAPLEKAAALSGAEMRSLLYQAAVRETDPEAKARLIEKAIQLSAKTGHFATAARVFAPVIAAIKADKSLAWFGPHAYRVLVFTGQAGQASDWLVVLRAAAMFETNLVLQTGLIMPLAAYVNHPLANNWFDKGFQNWWPYISKRDDLAADVPQMLGLLQAVDRYVPETVWAVLLENTSRRTVSLPNPAIWSRLPQAAEAGRLGETVMLALIVLGNGGPEAVDTLMLDHVMKALRRVGLVTEAYDLGLEALAPLGY